MAECSPSENVTQEHQAPALEATLPEEIGGRPLARWSLRGRCWFASISELTPTELDQLRGLFETPGDPGRIDLENLTFALAGRSDVSRDPPYLVFAMGRPVHDDEVSMALLALFQTSGYLDPDPAVAGDLNNYDAVTLGGKEVSMGTEQMLKQNEHQRGRPALYQTDDYMYVVVTDDLAWADEVFSKLP